MAFFLDPNIAAKNIVILRLIKKNNTKLTKIFTSGVKIDAKTQKHQHPHLICEILEHVVHFLSCAQKSWTLASYSWGQRPRLLVQAVSTWWINSHLLPREGLYRSGIYRGHWLSFRRITAKGPVPLRRSLETSHWMPNKFRKDGRQANQSCHFK